MKDGAHRVEFRKDYCLNKGFREQLYPLFDRVFGISPNVLADYYGRGFWDETYRPYTLFESNCAIANVSWFDLPILVAGRPISAAGIQSVMTHPDYRGRGLMKNLFEVMLRDIDSSVEMSLLFTENPMLYIPFGFRVLPETYFMTRYEHSGQCKEKSFRRLAPFDPVNTEVVKELLRIRVAASEHFFPLHYAPSFFLNLYDHQAQERLYYASDVDALLVFSVKDDTLEIYDLISPNPLTLSDICIRVPVSFSRVAVHFNPDRFMEWDWIPASFQTTSSLMIRGHINVPEYLKYPETAKF